VLLVLVVPIGLSGALLPMLFHELRREVRDLGAVAGRLYAWNTVGSLLGALLGGYLLLLWLDLHHVYRIALGALALGAGILSVLVVRASRIGIALVVLPSVVGAIWLLPPWPPERLVAGFFRTRTEVASSFLGPERHYARQNMRVLFYDDDPTSTVAVLEPPRSPSNRSISVNGKSDGALESDYATMALSALLPALIADRYESCFVIGLGTGVTIGELAALEDTRTIEVAEISRGVIAARPFFDEGNLEASKSPKVRIRRGDAYRTLLGSKDRYDLIVSEPSNPWVSGVEMLYSREFLEAARDHLAPGGVYAQWFHLYETDAEVVELVLRTYASVFPHVSVWFALGPDLLLLGIDRPDRALDVAALEARFRRPDLAAGFRRVGIESLPALLAHEILPLGTLHAAALQGDVHTLRNPVLSYRAARAFFVGRAAAFPALAEPAPARIGESNSLLRRFAGNGARLPEDVLEAGARENCRFGRLPPCAAFVARWKRDHPDSLRFEAAVTQLRAEPENRQSLLPPRIASLIPLWGSFSADSEPIPRAQAMALSRRFLRFYQHAIPFDRQVLEEAWDRCRGEPCAEGRRWVEEQVGPLASR
jgi:spermidine synthase